MALTQYYVNPAIAGNSGTGTIGDPWGDLQYAFSTATQDATNGDVFNIKTGTDEILAAPLNLSTYGTPTATTPLVLRGYTTAAADGGIGGINCNDATMFADTTLDYIALIDLHIHNGGAANIVDLDDFIIVANCEIDDTTGDGIDVDIHAQISNCYIHNVGTRGVDCTIGASVHGCYFENGTNSFGRAIAIQSGSTVEFNIIKLTGASDGVIPGGNNATIANNTIYSTSGTGEGINNAMSMTNIINNYIEGFSGAGGDGILSTVVAGIIRGNRYYNNTNSYNVTGNVIYEGDNSALTASGLVSPSTGDFRAKGNLRAGAWPATFPAIALPQYLDIGAVQRKEPVRMPRMMIYGR